MLSDEEKEAIEWLKGLVKIIKRDNLDNTYAGILLNLIEKQSKEIEDNKRYIDLHYVPYEQYTSKLNELNKKWEDKIKVKIEPVLKQLDIKMKEEYNKYGNSREYQDIVDAYNFLQSLLEKE